MIRLIASSLIVIIALYIYCFFRKRLHRILQHIFCAEKKPYVEIRATLVKDPHTGKYYVR